MTCGRFHLPRIPFSLRLPLFFALLIVAPHAGRADTDDFRGDPGDRLVMPRVKPQPPSGRTRLVPSRVTEDGDTLWVGHSMQTVSGGDHTTYNDGPYHVGVGANRPGASTGA